MNSIHIANAAYTTAEDDGGICRTEKKASGYKDIHPYVAIIEDSGANLGEAVITCTLRSPWPETRSLLGASSDDCSPHMMDVTGRHERPIVTGQEEVQINVETDG